MNLPPPIFPIPTRPICPTPTRPTSMPPCPSPSPQRPGPSPRTRTPDSPLADTPNLHSPLLAGLNEPQQQAVLHDSGPVLIFAGAGSGKTNALTKRIAYLIRERYVRPYNILAVTFTNKAAAEMKERIANLVGDLAMRDLWAGTFHSLCARCLRERGPADRPGQELRHLRRRRPTGPGQRDRARAGPGRQAVRPPRRAVADLQSQRNAANARGHPERLHAPPRSSGPSGKAYQLYQSKLTLSNALDFDDLIMKTVQLLRESEKAREHYQNRFHYVHCDEFQDVNDSQYQLLTLFAGKHKNICVVGDDDQCVVEGTPILTPSGYVPVEQIKEGDTVLAACGGPYLAPAIVEKVMVNDYAGPVRHIQTEQGAAVRVTPNHVMFGCLDRRCAGRSLAGTGHALR